MDIPEDVVALILVRLPVRSLLRFRCVCKCWRDLIGSRRFIDLHLEQGSRNDYLVVKRFDTKDDSTVVSYYCRDEDGESLRTAAPDFEDFPPTAMFSGACNGICLVCAQDLSDWLESPLYLCNPATRELRKIPDRPFGIQRARPSKYGISGPPFRCRRRGAGFGYDHRTNDYKVVSIMLFLEENYHLETQYGPFKIEIYSVSSNSWRVADTVFPSINLHPDPGLEHLPMYTTDLNMSYFENGMFGDFICGLFLNGSIHWKGLWHYKVILAFNVGDEVMQAFRLPRGVSGSENFFPRCLFSLEDSLAYVQYVIDGPSGDFTPFYVWVMAEYGDDESWVRRFYLQPGVHMGVLAVWDDELICETEDGDLASCSLREDAPHFRKRHHIKRYVREFRHHPHEFFRYPCWELVAALVMHKQSLVRLSN